MAAADRGIVGSHPEHADRGQRFFAEARVGAVSIETVHPDSAPEWEAFVDGRRDATCYHLRAWQTAAGEAYGLATPSLMARDAASGRVVGILPLFVVRNWLGGYATTGIFGAYGRVLAENDECRRALLQRARRIVEQQKLDYLLHKSVGEEPLEDGWVRNDGAVTAVLLLPEDASRLWAGFRKQIRNCVRKAQRSGLTVRVGPSELGGYYDVLAANMHRKGTPIYGRRFMSSLLAALGDRAYVITLSKDGEVVSGAFVVEYKGTASVPFASSRVSAFPFCPNNLLYWEIMKRACERGMERLDFGRSFRGSGNLAFKLHWGANVLPQPLYSFHRRRPPRLDPADPTVRRLAGIWSRTPRVLADRVGPALCARFLV